MKKYLVSIFTILFVMPAMAITISGTVLDENDKPLAYAAATIEGTNIGAATDTNGKFSIETKTTIPENAKIQISILGYETQTLDAVNNLTVHMEPAAETIEAVTVTAEAVEQCEPKTGEKDVVKDFESKKCYVVSCVSDRYKLTNPQTAYRNNRLISFNKNSEVCEYTCEKVTVGTSCEDQVGKKCTPNNASNYKAAEYKWENNQLTCKITKCEDKYLPNDDGTACELSEGPCTEVQVTAIENATAGELKKGVCHVTKCEYGYKANKQKNTCEKLNCTGRYVLNESGDDCEDQVGKKCTPKNTSNYKAAEYKWENEQLICEITKCEDKYLPNDDGTACELSEGPCTEAQVKAIENATAGELKKGVCHVTECKDGFEVSDGKCVNISGDCSPMPENATAAHRAWDSTSNTEICIVDSCKDNYMPSSDGLSCVSTLSAEDSAAKIAELQKNADDAKAKEQSTANRLLGAAAIGSVGIGGMQVASALAEQSADSAAERDMSAYLATFKCDYGQGMNIKGGESNITLPGANVLLPIYNEYTTLAADLKARKEALEMEPGIESEVILDAATSGLYDNESIGFDGTYTSLSRALMDGNSEDAAAWAAQKSDTASQLQTGAIVAGAGALVGIVGDVLINDVADKRKENSDEIIAKYDAKRQTIRTELQPIEKQSEQEVTANPPESEEGKDPDEQEKTEVKATTIIDTVKTAITGTEDTSSNANGTVATLISTVTGNAADKQTEAKTTPKPIVTIYNESMFDSGKTQIKQPTTKLDEVIETLKKQIGDETVFEIVLVAHTDKDKIIQSSSLCTQQKICTNEQLSAARAESVSAYIKSKWPTMPNTAKITALPVGSACAKGTTKAEKAKDRRVDFYVFFAGEDTSTINTCQTGA